MPCSCSSSATSFYGSDNGYNTKSMTPNRSRSDSAYSKGYGGRTPVNFPLMVELVGEPVDASRFVDGISVTIRFRPLRTCICFCIRRSSEIHFLVRWFPTEEKSRVAWRTLLLIGYLCFFLVIIIIT